MEHGEQHITVIDDNGDEHLCEVMYTFDSEKHNKSYVLYYLVGSEDEEGNIEIHASSFTPSEGDEGGDLQPIETEYEWEMIEEVLNTLQDEFEDEE